MGRLVGSVGGRYKSWSHGCGLKPHTGCGDYLKIKFFFFFKASVIIQAQDAGGSDQAIVEAAWGCPVLVVIWIKSTELSDVLDMGYEKSREVKLTLRTLPWAAGKWSCHRVTGEGCGCCRFERKESGFCTEHLEFPSRSSYSSLANTTLLPGLCWYITSTKSQLQSHMGQWCPLDTSTLPKQPLLTWVSATIGLCISKTSLPIPSRRGLVLKGGTWENCLPLSLTIFFTWKIKHIENNTYLIELLSALK